MNRPLLFAPVLLLSVGCGGVAPDGTESAGFGLELSAALAGQVTAFQVGVLPATFREADGSDGFVDCSDLQATCLKGSSYEAHLLTVKNAQGAQVKVVSFPASLDSGAQDVTVQGIP